MENKPFYQDISSKAGLGQEASQQASLDYKQRENQSNQQTQQSYPMFNPLFRPISYFPPKSDSRQDNIAPVRTDNGAKVFSLFETARMPPNFMFQSQQEQIQEANKEPLSYNPYFYQSNQQQKIESQINQQPHFNQKSESIRYQQQFQQEQDPNFQLLKEFERNMNPQSAYRTEGGERVFSLMCAPCQEFSFQGNFQPNKLNQNNREYENYYLEEGMQGQNSSPYQQAYLNEIQGNPANYKGFNDQYLGVQLQQNYPKEKSQTSQKDLKQGANKQAEKQEQMKQNKKEEASGLILSQYKNQNRFIYQQIKQMHQQISKQIQDLEQQRQNFQNIMDILVVQDQSLEEEAQTEKMKKSSEKNEDQTEQHLNYQSQQGQLKESIQLQNRKNQTEKEFTTQNLQEAENKAKNQNQQISQSNKDIKELNSEIQSAKEDTKDQSTIIQTKNESETLKKQEQMSNQ